MSMDPDTAARTADMLERHLTRVAEGTWSPLQFVDAMSDFVSELRATASTTNVDAQREGDAVHAVLQSARSIAPSNAARRQLRPFLVAAFRAGVRTAGGS